MSRVLNSFALLGDEEDDDVTVLAEHLSKKAVLSASDSTAPDGKGTGYSVYIGNLPTDATIDHVGDKLSEFGPIKYGGIQVRSSKQGFCFGFVEFESSSSAQKAIEASPFQIGEKKVFVEEKRANRGPDPGRGERFGTEQEYGPRRNYFNGNGRGGGMGRRGFNNVVGDDKEGYVGNGYNNGNGAVRSYGNGNDRRPFQSGNRNYGGERRGGGYGGNYGNNVNHVHQGRRDGKDNEQQSSNGDVKETPNAVADTIAVDSESSKAVSEGEAAPVTEEPREVVAKETPQGKFAKTEAEYLKKKQEEYQKWLAQYKTWKTLGEYEKVVAEKRKALEALKNEERKVAADKDFEAMELLDKKKKDTSVQVNSKASKLRRKPSLDKAEEPTSLKEEKTRKVALSIVQGFLKPTKGNNSSNGEQGGGSKKGGPGVAHIPINDQCEFPDLKGAARAV